MLSLEKTDWIVVFVCFFDHGNPKKKTKKKTKNKEQEAKEEKKSGREKVSRLKQMSFTFDCQSVHRNK